MFCMCVSGRVREYRSPQAEAAQSYQCELEGEEPLDDGKLQVRFEMTEFFPNDKENQDLKGLKSSALESNVKSALIQTLRKCCVDSIIGHLCTAYILINCV